MSLAQQTSYLTDPLDFCRSCKGTGVEYEEGSRPGVRCATTCYQCGGSGSRSVRVTSPKAARAAA